MTEKDTDVLYSVYFLDCGGHLIGQPMRVARGAAAQPPEYTPPASQEFLGWSRPTSCVMENIYCVAVTREKPLPAPPQADCRVTVLDVRGQKRASLLPLGNWTKGETLTKDDMACLHLRHMEKLRPFRCTVAGDTLLAVTDAGVRAFDYSMRPLEGMLELMPLPQQPAVASVRPGLLAREA